MKKGVQNQERPEEKRWGTRKAETDRREQKRETYVILTTIQSDNLARKLDATALIFCKLCQAPMCGGTFKYILCQLINYNVLMC